MVEQRRYGHDPETESGFVNHDGVDLAFRLEGPAGAPVIALVNSLGTTMALWDPQIGPLTKYFRVLRYDHRGHGASSAPAGPYSMAQLGADLLAVLDALSIEHAAVCGISLGGMVAMWVGANAPDRVTGLVLAATAPVLGPVGNWTERAAVVRRDGIGNLAESIIPRWFTTATRADRPDVVAAVVEMIASCDPEGYASCCEAIGAMDQRGEMAQVVAPTLVVHGSDDQVTPPAAGLALADAISGSTFCVLPGAAHLVNLAQPGRFVTLVIDHLAGSAAERGMAVRRAVLGEAHVARSTASASPLTAPFQDLITRYAWGEIWSRPALDRRTRSAITIAMLVARGQFDELEFHLPAAVTNGLHVDEIREVLLQSAIYAGVPAARSAFAVADRVLGPDS